MSGKKWQANVEFNNMLKVLCGREPEKYFMQKYIVFWEFVGLLLYREDPITREDLRVYSVARLVSSASRREISGRARKSGDLKRLIDSEFTTEICAKAITSIAESGALGDALIDDIDLMYGASRISEALLRLSTVKDRNPRGRASLARALDFVLKGGIDLDEDGKPTRLIVSLASLKSYWRDLCHTFPFVLAFEAHDLEIAIWSPVNLDGVVEFSKETKANPELLSNIFAMANTIQKEMLGLLDPAAKGRAFLNFPDECPTAQWEPEPLNSNQLEVAARYRTSR